MANKILVVDDEPLICTTIHRALAKRGYEVSLVTDADEFLAALRAERPDLIVLDINLGGVNSETLLDEIYSIAPRVKILFMSGVMPHIHVDHFLEKPFRIEDLRNKVGEILGAAASSTDPQ